MEEGVRAARHHRASALVERPGLDGVRPQALPSLVPVTWSCEVLSATRGQEPQRWMAEGGRLNAGPPGPGLRDVNGTARCWNGVLE